MGANDNKLAQELLSAPSRSSPCRWRQTRWRRLLVGVLIAYHVLAVLLYHLPGARRRDGWLNGVYRTLHTNTYIKVSGQSQSWGLFAPDPWRTNKFLKVFVQDRNGDHWDLKNDIRSRRRYPYIIYSRRGKINRRVMKTAWYQGLFAASICRRWELDHGGEPAQRVLLVALAAKIPKPTQVIPIIGYSASSLPTKESVLSEFVCSDIGYGQLPNSVRRRHHLPLVDERTIKPKKAKNWTSSKKFKRPSRTVAPLLRPPTQFKPLATPPQERPPAPSPTTSSP